MDKSLDALYVEWTTEKCERTLEELLSAVRHHAKRNSGGRSEDVEDFAQQVCITVWQHLHSFQQHTSTAFERWLSVIFKYERLRQSRQKLHISNDGQIEQAAEDDAFVNIAILPDNIKEIAKSLLSGYTIKETAQRMDVKDGTLRKRLFHHKTVTKRLTRRLYR